MSPSCLVPDSLPGCGELLPERPFSEADVLPLLRIGLASRMGSVRTSCTFGRLPFSRNTSGPLVCLQNTCVRSQWVDTESLARTWANCWAV